MEEALCHLLIADPIRHDRKEPLFKGRAGSARLLARILV
jgi:hypothetical protein